MAEMPGKRGISRYRVRLKRERMAHALLSNRSRKAVKLSINFLARIRICLPILLERFRASVSKCLRSTSCSGRTEITWYPSASRWADRMASLEKASGLLWYVWLSYSMSNLHEGT